MKKGGRNVGRSKGRFCDTSGPHLPSSFPWVGSFRFILCFPPPKLNLNHLYVINVFLFYIKMPIGIITVCFLLNIANHWPFSLRNLFSCGHSIKGCSSSFHLRVELPLFVSSCFQTSENLGFSAKLATLSLFDTVFYLIIFHLNYKKNQKQLESL